MKRNQLEKAVHTAFIDRHGKPCLFESSMLGNISGSVSHQILRSTYDRHICQVTLEVFPPHDQYWTYYMVWQIDDDEAAVLKSVKERIQTIKTTFDQEKKQLDPFKGVLFDEHIGHGKFILKDTSPMGGKFAKRALYMRHRHYEGDAMNLTILTYENGETKTFASIDELIHSLDMSELMKLNTKQRDEVLYGLG